MYRIDWDKLCDYETGWITGVFLYAWNKDGILYVGSTGKMYRDAIRDFLVERGKADAFIE